MKYHVPTIILFLSGVFRRETASGFYPWSNVEDPRKRVAEGLCGWRHGNSFPMTQSAQSHRQMRSIPRCSKAVFYVFVFGSIHDSTTLHNPSTQVKNTGAGPRRVGAAQPLGYCFGRSGGGLGFGFYDFADFYDGAHCLFHCLNGNVFVAAVHVHATCEDVGAWQTFE